MNNDDVSHETLLQLRAPAVRLRLTRVLPMAGIVVLGALAMTESRPRSIVAEFHKSAGKRLTLFSLTVIEARGEHLARTIYDVEHSRAFGYVYDQSGFGGGGPVKVEGIYFSSGNVKVKEGPCQLVDSRDRPPWRGKKTRIIRERNRTRRLRRLPSAFDIAPGSDLLNWLQHNAIEDHAVYCSECRDFSPAGNLCCHCWWCSKKCWYSTPSDRCDCKNRDECDS